MDDIIKQIANCNINNLLENDVNEIIKSYTENRLELDKSNLIYKNNHNQVYNQILCILTSKNMIIELLELMPYIDDYLEYLSNF
jgi:hypothetical protein